MIACSLASAGASSAPRRPSIAAALRDRRERPAQLVGRHREERSLPALLFLGRDQQRCGLAVGLRQARVLIAEKRAALVLNGERQVEVKLQERSGVRSSIPVEAIQHAQLPAWALRPLPRGSVCRGRAATSVRQRTFRARRRSRSCHLGVAAAGGGLESDAVEHGESAAVVLDQPGAAAARRRPR